MERADEVVTVRVVAETPLLQRGLLRAAVAAGFTVVPADLAAQVTLRTQESSRTGTVSTGSRADIEVTVDLDSIVVTVQQVPDVRTLLRVHGLLAALLGAESRRQPG